MRPLIRGTVAIGATIALTAALAGCASVVSAVVPGAVPASTSSRVVVIGDSITRGRGVHAWQAWPSLLSVRGARITDVSCDGAGVLAEGDGECTSTYEGLVGEAVALRPAVVVVQASSNDLGQDDGELSGGTDQLIAELHRELPAARVVGLSAVWDQSAPPPQLAVISADLRSAVQSVGGRFVDIGQPLRGHARWMQSDDVHPTPTGQRAIAVAVIGALRRDHVTL